MIDTAFQDQPATNGLRRKRRLSALLALALLPPLSGCLAVAVAVPVMTAVGMVTQRARVRAATPVPQAQGSAASAARPRPAPVGSDSASGARLTSLTELPAPARPGMANDPWQPFVSYALERASTPDRDESVLLSPSGSSTLAPRMRDCQASEPAVILDLDNGPAAFSPATAGPPSPGLAEGLARLREAGVIVLWISQLHANHVREVADALTISGLDPTGHDPLLLMRNEDDRKQTLREEANLDVCVIAIAGDRRGDFDELFDYLREPNAALGLEGLIGSGWFIAPEPFGASPAP